MPPTTIKDLVKKALDQKTPAATLKVTAATAETTSRREPAGQALSLRHQLPSQ